MRYCPECGREFGSEIVACPDCRVVLVEDRPAAGGTPTVAYRVPDAAAGALLLGVLEQHGIAAVLRSAMLPGYGVIRRDWGTSAWGEILVPAAVLDEARAAITEYLSELERGGQVRDEDVEGEAP